MYDTARKLLGPRGLQSASQGLRRAASDALGTCMSLGAASAWSPLTDSLERLLDRSEHDRLTEEELIIFFTPEGKLSSETEEAAVLAATFDAGRPREKSRFLAGVEVQVQPVQGAKKGAKVDPREEKRAYMLAEERVVREAVGSIKDRLDLGLQLASAAALGNHKFASQRLDDLSGLVLPLLGSRLVGGTTATEATTALARCLPDPLGPHGPSLAAALSAVLAAGDGGRVNVDKISAAREALEAVHDATHPGGSRRVPLPSPVYHFVFPLVRSILRQPAHTSLHDMSLDVLSLHVDPSHNIPRVESFQVLAFLLTTVPATRERVMPLMETLARGMTDDELARAAPTLLSPNATVRMAVLRALLHVPCLVEGQAPDREDVVSLLWVAGFDGVEEIAAVGRRLWEDSGARLLPHLTRELVRHLGAPHVEVRKAAADALAAALEQHPAEASDVMGLLILQAGSAEAPLTARSGSILALGTCARALGKDEVPVALDFLLSQALVDPVDSIRAQAVEAGVLLVDAHGPALSGLMLPMFERFLEPGAAKKLGMDETSYDRVREGTIVFLGTLARHMTTQEGKVRGILSTLLDALTTPSEPVQRAVARCLPPLIQSAQGDRGYVEGIINSLLSTVTSSPKYGDRMGAAFGLAGAVKGMGIGSLKGFGIMDAIKASMDNKKDANAREGALHALASLCETLGR